MDNFLKYNLLVFLMIGSVSCKGDLLGFFDSSSDDVDTRTEYSLAWNRENGFKTIISPQEEYQLCITADTHIGTTENFVKVETVIKNSSLAIILVGDITNGREMDYQTTATLFSYSTTDIITMAGNHDIEFGGWKYFKKYFGASVFYFEVHTPTANDLYICLDSGNGTLGKRQYDWLKNILASKRENYRHCFIYSHTNLFRTDGSQTISSNMPLEETYQLMDLLGKNRINGVFMGHDHHREELVFNGVKYVTLDALRDGMKSASYVILTVNTNYSYQFFAIALATER